MTTLRGKILDKIIADLRGTCQDMDDVAKYWGIDELSIEDMQYIESEIFLCAGCGWWCELCEQHYEDGEPLCQDCYESTDHDEE